jgi:hypothetical protein
MKPLLCRSVFSALPRRGAAITLAPTLAAPAASAITTGWVPASTPGNAAVRRLVSGLLLVVLVCGPALRADASLTWRADFRAQLAGTLGSGIVEGYLAYVNAGGPRDSFTFGASEILATVSGLSAANGVYEQFVGRSVSVPCSAGPEGSDGDCSLDFGPPTPTTGPTFVDSSSVAASLLEITMQAVPLPSSISIGVGRLQSGGQLEFWKHPIPEPSTGLLVLTGLLGFAVRRGRCA